MDIYWLIHYKYLTIIFSTPSMYSYINSISSIIYFSLSYYFNILLISIINPDPVFYSISNSLYSSSISCLSLFHFIMSYYLNSSILYFKFSWKISIISLHLHIVLNYYVLYIFVFLFNAIINSFTISVSFLSSNCINRFIY